MSIAGLALLASTCLYAGFQWTIRVLVYPQLQNVGAAEFVAYERRHQQLTSIAVGPLFAAFGISALAAVLVRAGVASVVAAACFLVILGLTAFAAVPRHRRLSTRFTPAAHRELLRVDTTRLVTAAVACVAAGAFALGA